MEAAGSTMQTDLRLASAGASEARTASGVNVCMRRIHGAALCGIVAATVVGCLLRIVMAQGDLWLDEAWSLKLVAGISSPWAVFWEISHDNNHFLNSFWLSWLGPEAPAWAYRVPSVVFGTLAIPIAAGIGWRRGRVGAVVAAWFVALSMPLVIYGSEARGYAGLVACSLVAIASFEPAFDGLMVGQTPGRSQATWILGLSIGIGTLCHLTMLATLAIPGLTAALRLKSSGRNLGTCIDLTTTLFGPSLLCLLPAMAAILAGLVYRGGFETGDVVTFTISDFGAGFGGMLRCMLGLPRVVPTSLVFFVATALVVVAFTVDGIAPLLRSLGFAGLIVLPAGMAFAHLPNLEFPRYFLVPGLVSLLIEADLVGRLWGRGSTIPCVAAISLLCATTIGQAAADLSAVVAGRGASGEALSIMAQDGRAAYSSDSQFKSATVAEVAARRQHIALTYVSADRFCSDVPDWYIVTDGEAEAPSLISLGQGSCSVPFAKRATFPASELSGMRWILYRRSR